MIHFRVSADVPLHRMFSVLERARDELVDLIEDYTVTQVTLDDVFVSFAQMQQEGDPSEAATETATLQAPTPPKTSRVRK